MKRCCAKRFWTRWNSMVIRWRKLYLWLFMLYAFIFVIYICLNSFPFCMYNKTSHSSKKCNACSRQVTIVYDVVNNKDVNIMLRVNNIGPYFIYDFFPKLIYSTSTWWFWLAPLLYQLFFLSIVDLYFYCQQAEYVIIRVYLGYLYNR